MNYQDILKKIAEENKTTPQEVEKEMRQALLAAGIKDSPEDFITKTARQVKDDSDK